MLSDRIKNGVCVLVSVAWAINAALAAASAVIGRGFSYEPDPAINIAFTAVLGFVMVSGTKDKDKGRHK